MILTTSSYKQLQGFKFFCIIPHYVKIQPPPPWAPLSLVTVVTKPSYRFTKISFFFFHKYHTYIPSNWDFNQLCSYMEKAARNSLVESQLHLRLNHPTRCLSIGGNGIHNLYVANESLLLAFARLNLSRGQRTLTSPVSITSGARLL